jgi:hypothetical protein
MRTKQRFEPGMLMNNSKRTRVTAKATIEKIEKIEKIPEMKEGNVRVSSKCIVGGGCVIESIFVSLQKTCKLHFCSPNS